MGAFWVILSAFGFSTLGIFGKLAYVAGFNRSEMLFWRFLFALPVFAVLLVLTQSTPKNARTFSKTVLLGAIGIGVEASLFFLTLEHVGAALTGIFLYLYPAFVALISHFFLNERLNFQKWLCIGLALVGCLFTLDFDQARLDGVGIIYGVLTAAWYAGYIIVGGRMIQNENPLTVSAGITLGSFITFSLVLFLQLLLSAGSMSLASLKYPQTQGQWLPLLGLAGVATVLPFATLYLGIKKVGATHASVLSTIELLFTLVLAVVFLGEKLTVFQMFGAFLILLSVLLIKRVR